MKDSVKDLGVTMGAEASFRKHIKSVVETANSQCGWILRTFRTRAITPMLTLWKSMVLCKLDYCSQLWCPSEKGDIQLLEMVQRSFLRRVSGLGHLSYWELLRYLKLYSLERRREHYLIIYTWRILKGRI